MTKPDRNAVVTGTAGIALGVAERLLDDGFAVTLCGINPAQNEAARERLKGRAVTVVALDVSDAAAVERFAADFAAGTEALDALVNCAAIQTYGNLETTTPDDWDKVIRINLTGYYLMAHYLYPLLKTRGSAAIVNIASVQGHMNQNNVLGYATTKGAIHALTRAMAVDCAKDGVRVNSISPGSIRTPLLEFSARELTPEGGDWEETLAGFG
ncbi:MAG: SDR family oxidoreductase, partial [Rhizobiales bacterium]|nr:SDR family oxidoreductase [Hyphomicrobiales bacterium]